MVENWWSTAGSAGLVVGMSIWNVPAQHHAVLNHKLAKSESSAENPTLRYKREGLSQPDSLSPTDLGESVLIYQLVGFVSG